MIDLAAALAELAAGCVKRAHWVALGAVLLGLVGALAIKAELGVNTDTGTLFSASLPWKQQQDHLRDLFPQTKKILVAVIDAALPEEADETAGQLAKALAADRLHFSAVREPASSPYLKQNGLLFLDPATLGTVLDKTIDSQPFLGQLARDPSLNGVLASLSLIGKAIDRGVANQMQLEPGLLGFDAIIAEGGAHGPLSWENLLAGPVSKLAGRYRFVLLKPKLDYGALQPGATATLAIREAAQKLEFVRSGAAHVRITGPVALDDDEFATVAQGAAKGLLGSLALVTLWLWSAVRSWRLVLPILATLLLGLDLTAAFAALAVGTLNLVSIGFAVLFVGVAVDFSIQFSMRFREASAGATDNLAAMRIAASQGGVQIMIAALSASAGFLAFTPTSFVGVAQLGLIAGVGMLIAFACTVSVLPALITLCRPPANWGGIGFAWARPVDHTILSHRRAILAGGCALALLGLGLLPWLRFDGDPLNTKNQSSESVKTLADLAADPITNPYSIEMLVPSLADLPVISRQLRGLPTVGGMISLDSLVPSDQAAKLTMISDAKSVLTPSLALQPLARPDARALRAGIAKALPSMQSAATKLPANHPFAMITHDLQQLRTAPDAKLLVVNAAMTRFLPAQLAQLKTALDAQPVDRAAIPPELSQDWVAPNGNAKLEILPSHDLVHGSAGLRLFVAQVSSIAPQATGAAVAIVKSADAIVAAFRTATLGALFTIAIILLIALRRVLDAALVLAPLVLASLLTVIVMHLLALPLNFANIIALPLLLGVGVSFNVYFVMNWRAGIRFPLSSATARAVIFSALTTATAFGSLALSSHPGTASMGKLLLAGLGSTLLATLVFSPALLASVIRD